MQFHIFYTKMQARKQQCMFSKLGY